MIMMIMTTIMWLV